MAELPDGVVTFVFTDVEGSTALWEDAPEAMMAALVEHDRVIEDVVADAGGVSVKPRGEGDSRFLVFRSAHDAVTAAAGIQQALSAIEWPTPRPLRVRMSLHTGTAELMLGDYYGSAVNRAARLRGIAHGGQTVMSRATYELVRDELPDGVGVADLGEHRLKDLSRPEHVYQLEPQGHPVDVPPLASLDAVRTNLPVQATEFVGRTRELADLEAAIERSRLVTVLAPGGAGKTRLAIQAAADLSADFGDGVFFADLAPLGDADDVPQAVAEAMGVTLGGDESQEDQLIGHLRGRELLLVMDNLEHLPDATALLSRVLAECAGTKILATSRIKLNVMGEAVFRLSGLDHDWETLEEAYESAAVRLFVDTARRADAAFTLGDEELVPLGRILDMVAGLPLGIVLAASWVDVLSLAEIADEIASSMDFLESDGAGVERHRSMRAVFDYSWALLTPDERTTLATLSMFRGGFTRDAASEVAGASLRSLKTLETKSLIGFERDRGRYAVHELIREYAGEQLAGDDEQRALEAHAAYFARLADDASLEFFSGADQVAAIERLDADFQNLRAVLRRAVAAHDPVKALSVISAAAFVMETRGWLQAAHELVDDVLDEFSASSDDESERVVAALAIAQRARISMNLGLDGDEFAAVEAAVEELRRSADKRSLGIGLEAQAELMTYAGRGEDLRVVTAEAVEVALLLGFDVWAAGMHNYEAVAHLLLDRTDDAMRTLLAGDEVLAAAGERYMRVWNLEAQATILSLRGDAGAAIAKRELVVDLARSVGYARAEALGLYGLGSSYLTIGEVDEADAALHQALATFERMGMAVEQALVLIELAGLSAATGNPTRAVEILAAVLAHRTSDMVHPLQQVVVRHLVSDALDELRDVLDEPEFSSAAQNGVAKGFGIVVKEVLAEDEGVGR